MNYSWRGMAAKWAVVEISNFNSEFIDSRCGKKRNSSCADDVVVIVTVQPLRGRLDRIAGEGAVTVAPVYFCLPLKRGGRSATASDMVGIPGERYARLTDTLSYVA